MVWAACDALDKAPLDNRAALFRSLADVLVVVQDTVREMAELSQDAQSEGDRQDRGEASAGSHDSGAQANGDGEGALDREGHSGAEDLDFEAGPLSEAEVDVLGAVQELMASGSAVVKAVGRVLLQGEPAMLACVDGRGFCTA